MTKMKKVGLKYANSNFFQRLGLKIIIIKHSIIHLTRLQGDKTQFLFLNLIAALVGHR